MTDRHAVAAQMALLKVLDKQLKKAQIEVAKPVGEWRPKDRAAAVLPGGQEIGAVTLVTGAKKARMSDEAAFLAWVEKTHPEEMETVTTTRPNPQFVARLMNAAQKLGQPVDAASGESVPGITVEQLDPHPMVKLTADAPEVVAAAWREVGMVELLGSLLRPAVEGGDQ